MGLIVQKFGGTSVADSNCLNHIADIIIKELNEGNQVISVVSAQGNETDLLLSKAKELAKNAAGREVDALLSAGEQIAAALLSIALIEKGVNALSMNGWQARILTNSNFGNGQILCVDTAPLLNQLSKGKTLVITGFQGIDAEGNIITLGRGGSDATAVALASALNADECRIYKDVDGIFDQDPHTNSKAKKYEKLSFREMLFICDSGSGVLQKNCVELAQKKGVKLLVYSVLTDALGTIIE